MTDKKRSAPVEESNDDSTFSTAPSKRQRKEPTRFHHEQAATASKSTSTKHNVSSTKISIYSDRQSLPVRDKKGFLVFPDHPEFRPNLTPKEVLQRGSFGGTYFRQITSGVTGETYKNVWKEFPSDWFE
eukprot:gene13256-16209_t